MLFFEDLNTNCNDSGKLFHQIRRLNGYTAEPTSTLNVDGAHYEGKDLPEAWASYFANLATPCDNGYDSEFADYNSGEFSNISSQPPADNIEFTPEEVKKKLSCP